MRDASGKFTNGHPRLGGRKHGDTNHDTREVKRAIEMAFDGIGGVPALIEWAKSNRELFYTRVWIKLLPRDFNLVNQGPTLAEIIEASLDRGREYDAESQNRSRKADTPPLVPDPKNPRLMIQSSEGVI